MQSLTITESDTPNARDEVRWAAVAVRDSAADGVFWYGVVTTGVFCRPSCASRLARRENVRFYESCKEAEHAGFRPCKRCRPDQPGLIQQYATMVAETCRQIENAETPPGLDALALSAGMSRYHFHRIFKAVTGVTPKAYSAALRAKRVREKLSGSGTMTDAVFDAGFNSSGRFYAASNQLLGMTPARFRAGGRDAVIRFAVGECSLGAILVAATDQGVCAILLGDDADVLVRDLQDRFPRADLIGANAMFEQTVARVVGLVEKPAQGLALPLDVRGTAFQLRVWQALREIPAGSTASYSEIAERIGAPRAARAVAQACATNVLAIAIPCHRVVRRDGALSGYRWGVARKCALLEREKDQ